MVERTVIPFQKPNSRVTPGIITKIVDGKLVEVVDVDALSPRAREEFFKGEELKDGRIL
jgi:hypothetical protein